MTIQIWESISASEWLMSAKNQMSHQWCVIEPSGPNSKFQENRSETTIKSQVKNEFSFPCIPIFDNL